MDKQEVPDSASGEVGDSTFILASRMELQHENIEVGRVGN